MDRHEFFFILWRKCRKKATKTKVFKLNKKLKKRQPWMNTEVLLLVNEKAKAYQLFRPYRENIEVKENFRVLSVRVKKETEIKRKYYSK